MKNNYPYMNQVQMQMIISFVVESLKTDWQQVKNYHKFFSGEMQDISIGSFTIKRTSVTEIKIYFKNGNILKRLVL